MAVKTERERENQQLFAGQYSAQKCFFSINENDNENEDKTITKLKR